MKRESMIKVLRYKAKHIKTKIKPDFFDEVADLLEKDNICKYWSKDIQNNNKSDQGICMLFNDTTFCDKHNCLMLMYKTEDERNNINVSK